MDRLAQGSSVMNFTRQLGGAFGVNIMAVMLDRNISGFSDVHINPDRVKRRDSRRPHPPGYRRSQNRRPLPYAGKR